MRNKLRCKSFTKSIHENSPMVSHRLEIEETCRGCHLHSLHGKIVPEAYGKQFRSPFTVRHGTTPHRVLDGDVLGALRARVFRLVSHELNPNRACLLAVLRLGIKMLAATNCSAIFSFVFRNESVLIRISGLPTTINTPCSH